MCIGGSPKEKQPGKDEYALLEIAEQQLSDHVKNYRPLENTMIDEATGTLDEHEVEQGRDMASNTVRQESAAVKPRGRMAPSSGMFKNNVVELSTGRSSRRAKAMNEADNVSGDRYAHKMLGMAKLGRGMENEATASMKTTASFDAGKAASKQQIDEDWSATKADAVGFVGGTVGRGMYNNSRPAVQ